MSLELTMKKRWFDLRRLLGDPVLLFSLIFILYLSYVFILYPLVKVFSISLFVENSFTLKRYFEAAQNIVFLKPLMNSLGLGLAVAVLSTIIGFVFAFSTTHAKLPGSKFLSVVATIPIISPPFVVALSGILLLGNEGLITKYIFGGHPLFNIYGFWGLLVVETLSYAPTSFLVLKGVLGSLDSAMEEAAYNLGARKRKVFTSIILPLCLPAIASSILLVFIESLADFGNPLILSGDFNVLSVQAYLEITALYDTGSGATLAVMLLIPSIIAYIVQKYVVGKKSYVTVTGKPSRGGVQARSKLASIVLSTFCGLFAAAVLLFYGTVVVGAFTKLWGVDWSFTLGNFSKVLSMGGQYIADTVILSAISAPITGVLGMILAFLVVRKSFPGRRALEFVSLLAFAVPGTVVGIGYIMAFNHPHSFLPIVLQGTPYIILLLFVFRNMPVGMQAGQAALRQIDPAIDEAAHSLGATSFVVFKKIILPLLAPAFFSGLIYSFVRAMTQISAVIFVVSGQWNLMTVYILGLVENGELSLAAAMSAILVAIVLVALSGMKIILGSLSGKQIAKMPM